MVFYLNHTKRKPKASGRALDFGVLHLRSTATSMVAAVKGHDWLFIDSEHGAFSVQETTQPCFSALHAALPLQFVSAPARLMKGRGLEITTRWVSLYIMCIPPRRPVVSRIPFVIRRGAIEVGGGFPPSLVIGLPSPSKLATSSTKIS